MGDIKARLRAKFARRNSAAPSLGSSASNSSTNQQRPPSADNAGSAALGKNSDGPASMTDSHHRLADGPGNTEEARRPPSDDGDGDRRGGSAVPDAFDLRGDRAGAGAGSTLKLPHSAASDHLPSSDAPGNDLRQPTTPRLFSISEHSSAPVALDQARPADTPASQPANESADSDDRAQLPNPDPDIQTPRSVSDSNLDSYGFPVRRSSSLSSRPAAPPRRQSILPDRQVSLIRTLLNNNQADDIDPSNTDHLVPINATMMTRKIWVKRSGASATLVTINEDDLVDDVREMILRKYANSLGRQFDAPDLTLRIVAREKSGERVLGPDEPMGRTLDAYFPGGQTVDEALVIDIPRRTPRASPRAGPPHAPHMASVYYDELRPVEAGTDYFGPGAVAHLPVTLTAPSGGGSHPHSISVINTGQIPQIPSPGGTRSRTYRDRADRPQLGRQHTSSPTVLNVGGAHGPTITMAASHGTQLPYTRGFYPASHSHTHSSASSEQQPGLGGGVPQNTSPIPTPPGHDPASASSIQRTSTPPPRTSSPRPVAASGRSKKKKLVDPPTLPAGMLNGGVPPINVLIVEDNIINLKLLEAFVKRLKVRWETAMNGREAVTKWRAGGFHLVLMDIQLPVMSGLDATREIRRLEKINSIGVFSSSASNPPEETIGEPSEEDKLVNKEMFKSPVIIVALTASSLQSDRHEALAAGCNDFLTKPVNFVWLERKVMEWGCMQALIDFDGWRKWKDFSQKESEMESSKKLMAKGKTKKNRQSMNFPS